VSDAADRTIVLLQRYHEGDAEALGELIARELPWIRQRVEARLGPALRARVEPGDLVQEALLELCRYGPRFQLASRAHFRALVATIVENVLRGRAQWWNAQRRALAAERPLPEGTCVSVAPMARSTDRPSVAAGRAEGEAWLRLALELLDPEDRDVLVLRQFRGQSFAEVGAALGIQENTARMRFQRALPRLAEKVRLLQRGEVDALLGERAT